MNQPLANLVEREVRIPIGDESVVGDLVVPAGAKALAVFAHGSGSSRHSPRNVWVAEQLHRDAIATLLFDLLTSSEDRRDAVTAEHRFDIALLGRRLVQVIDWCTMQSELGAMPLGLFGASTGSAAALVAAAQRPDRVRAVVSRGGRPDLAGVDVLARVRAPTLLIVGGRRRRARSQSPGARADEWGKATGDRAGRDASLRGTRHARARREPCGGLARRVPRRRNRQLKTNMRFANRRRAGEMLGEALARYRDDPDVVVLALPRGGVPVAYEVARALHAPLDVFVVRKLGMPGHEEFAMGAIATGGVMVINPDLVGFHVPQHVIDSVAARERGELERREQLYRGDRAPLSLAGRIVVLVDDGLATGSTMLAAATAVKQQQPQKVIVAVPVAAAQTCNALRAVVDEVVCRHTPEPFHAVGLWYDDFTQTTDGEVRALLHAARNTGEARPA
jgi:predicted phosphoribosyltransferase/dienelactone hydrolase